MLNKSVDYQLNLPPDFDDYEWEVEKKGWFECTDFFYEEKKYSISFYDLSRLTQEIEDKISEHDCFLEPNLIVVDSVNSKNMHAAIIGLIETGEITLLKPEIND